VSAGLEAAVKAGAVGLVLLDDPLTLGLRRQIAESSGQAPTADDIHSQGFYRGRRVNVLRNRSSADEPSCRGIRGQGPQGRVEPTPRNRTSVRATRMSLVPIPDRAGAANRADSVQTGRSDPANSESRWAAIRGRVSSILTSKVCWCDPWQNDLKFRPSARRTVKIEPTAQTVRHDVVEDMQAKASTTEMAARRVEGIEGLTPDVGAHAATIGSTSTASPIC
jgi:hypothetical protein